MNSSFGDVSGRLDYKGVKVTRYITAFTLAKKLLSRNILAGPANIAYRDEFFTDD